MSGCYASIPGFEFSPESIAEAVAQKRLLSMEIEFSRKCNFRCAYCYAADGVVSNCELTVEESRDVIVQAKDLGARKIIILGGEPMIYRGIFDLIEFMREQGLAMEMFTNGSNISVENAKRLFDNGVNVALKMNSFDEGVQDLLAQKKGAYRVIHKALRNLKAAGYPSDRVFLAVSTVICRQNLGEMADLWRWLRDQDVIPYLEMITPQGSAPVNPWLDLEPGELRDLFHEMARIDAERYGRTWEPQPPLVGYACLRHSFSCLVGASGDVMPCVGLPIAVGNVREKALREIIEDSEVIQDLRHVWEKIKGPCSECEKAGRCYGCRGAAYNLTGDYLASDPMCWRNAERGEEIEVLPVSVDGLIPHRSPMRLIDTLVSVGERSARTSVRVTRMMPFVGEDGFLDECAFIEMIAQSIAAMAGFKRVDRGVVADGMLVGAKDLWIEGVVRVGDLLEISVYKAARFGELGIVEGVVERDGTVVARGEIKVWEKAEAA